MKITNHTYTKENIIEQIYRYMSNNNQVFIPDTHLYKLENDLPNYGTIVRLFGSFKELANNFIPKNSKEGILIIIKKYLEDNNLDKLPTQKQIRACKELPSPTTIQQYFPNRKKLLEELQISKENGTNGTSIWEKEVVSFIKSITNETIEENDRTALENGKEIDIYIPDLDIGIECNGNYWHSNEHKNKEYHINKTNRAKYFDITLIHIFESEWESSIEEIKEYLRSMINPTTVQIYRGKNNLEIDNMKPMKYINIRKIGTTKPKLINIGKQKVWDCGTTIYEEII